ncbi:MAG TPA: hypothetical protein VGD61_23255 [Pyrinomonadaceae bacterium]
MYRKQVAFQLERTVPGTFLMQGLLGGVLGGFVAAYIAALAWKEENFVMTLDLVSLAVFTGGIVGIIKATIMRGVVYLIGIQYRALTRVAATIILTCLSVAVAGRQANFDPEFIRGWLIWALVVGIPVALLVGSQVKPWKLFTFGSMATGEVDQRSGSKSVLATLGALPLRFLSITAWVLLLLYLAPEFSRSRNVGEVLLVILFLSVAGFYFWFSAYLTFRSPRKIVLFVVGALINFPILLICLIALREFLHEFNEKVFIYVAISSSFLLAWIIFLVARLGAKLSPGPSLSITSNKSIVAAPNLDHQCLGSRFSEWQQHAA